MCIRDRNLAGHKFPTGHPYRRAWLHVRVSDPAGRVLFESGKCILCGICVKLTEMASEPLGLTFIGRGFDVKVSVPFDGQIEAGLQKVAAECVEHCPTGALVFAEKKLAGEISGSASLQHGNSAARS